MQVIVEFQKHIDQKLSFLKESKILVACSGGVDSVVLTHLLNTLKFDISVAHCNFSLRGEESDADEAFVLHLADKLSISVFTETFDTKKYAKENKLSTQMAARELRYRWFEEIKTNFKFDYIVTAHHADDSLETFLINLSRGTGLKGLTGIPEINETTVRPLLHFSRNEIVKYAKDNAFFWREDSSNAKADYVRNKLRLEVIPAYKEVVEDLLQSFKKTTKNLTSSQNLVDDYMALVFNLSVNEIKEGYSINLQKLQELPNTEALLYELLSPFGFTDLTAINDLLNSQSGKQVFSKTHRLLKDRNVFILTEIPLEDKNDEFFISENEKKIDVPIQLTFLPTDKVGYHSTNTIYVDTDKIKFPLQLRKWSEGDVFQPFGMKGKKKLSKFFKDEKLSLVAKENIWVLCSNKQIMWVIGHRPDERFKVTPETKQILKITRTT
jgi:tRNA(Ile)-lysidine synthase